jgi:peptidase E
MNRGKTKPLHLLAGGRGSRGKGGDPLLAAALRTAGVDRPSVAYVGTASGDNPAFRVMIGSFLKASGAGPLRLAPLVGRRADPDAAKKVLESSDIVFVSGGDVEEGMNRLADGGMADFLRNLHAEGVPFFGASAGSIMMARSWIRWSDPHEEASAELFPCLGLTPLLCDTHGEADGWSELRALLALCPDGTVGYGIRSGAALICSAHAGGTAAEDGLEASGGVVDRFGKRDGVIEVLGGLSPLKP